MNRIFLKYYFLYYVLLTIITGCKKGNESRTQDPTPSPSTETINAIIISTYSLNVGTGVPGITVFENNGTIRWKKPNRGNPQDGYTTYGDGIFFSSEYNTSGINTLYAYNINTGAELWSKSSLNEYYYYPTVRNDTLFCSTKNTGSAYGNIAAFNAKTGTLFWTRQIAYPYWPVHLTLDGNTLFFIVSVSSTDSRIASFNITTRTLNWVSSTLGINLASTFSKIAVSSDRVIAKTGTKLLVAFDRTTGVLAWSKPGIPFNQPVIKDNLVYCVCSFDSYYPSAEALWGLYAFNTTSGNQVWKSTKIHYDAGDPSIYGSVIFHSGMIGGVGKDYYYIKAYNVSSGAEIWSKNTGSSEYNDLCRAPVAMGNRVFAFKPNSGIDDKSIIVGYDAITGQPKDSIILTGETLGKIIIAGSSGKGYTPINPL